MHKRSLTVVAGDAGIALAGLAWADSISTTATQTIVSADGTVLNPEVSAAPAAAAAAAVGKIVTIEGTWTFSRPHNANGDYPILLNGANAGWGVLLEVINGKLYLRDKAGNYSVRWNAGWVASGTTGPLQGTVANTITLSVTLPKLPDDSPAGTIVATAAVTMSPPTAQFSGPLVSSDPLFSFNGMNVVLARALTAADDGTHPTAMISAVQ